MAQYETRSWIGWHHHMSLVAMAHLFITLTRRDPVLGPVAELDEVMLNIRTAVRSLEEHLQRTGSGD